MNVIYILWLRSLKHWWRSPAQIVASFGQPLLYLIGLGYGLGPVFAKAGNGSYLQFLAPGVIAVTVLFSGAFSGIGLIWDRQFGFLKETLVAPVPRLYVMIGRTLGGATVAMIQGLLVFILCVVFGFRPTLLTAVPLFFLAMALVAIVCCAFGTAIGSRMQSMQAFPLIMNFVMMPLFFLSGALYPLQGLPTALKAVVTVNPLTYGVDGMRGALIGASHFGVPWDLGVLAIVAAVFMVLGAWSFSKIEL
jgi:ABC-2 type transport system permease protein